MGLGEPDAQVSAGLSDQIRRCRITRVALTPSGLAALCKPQRGLGSYKHSTIGHRRRTCAEVARPSRA